MSPAHHIPVSKEFGVEKLQLVLPEKIHDRWQLRCVMDFDHVYDPNWATLFSTRKPYILILDLEQKVSTTTAMAKKIQKRFRKVVADPAFVFCKRRLLREFGDLERSTERSYSR
jgi:hypothetical protein